MPKLIPALCTLAALSWMGASSLPAETIYAISQDSNTTTTDLFSFDSATPNVITTLRPITGLNRMNPFLTTMAFRPADGQLYTEVGASVYRIDPATAQATLLSTAPGLSFTTIAFNPVTGLLRVIGTQGEADTRSYQVNVDTGAVIADGQSLPVRGLAYTNAYAGAGTTRLYGILAGDYLEIGSPANESQFTTVGRLGVPMTLPTLSGLSISGVTGTAYASFTSNVGTPGPYSSQFYTVDLNTGAGTLVGPIGNGTLFVEAIAAPVGPSQVAPVPEPTSWGLLGAGLLLGGIVRRWRHNIVAG